MCYKNSIQLKEKYMELDRKARQTEILLKKELRPKTNYVTLRQQQHQPTNTLRNSRENRLDITMTKFKNPMEEANQTFSSIEGRDEESFRTKVQLPRSIGKDLNSANKSQLSNRNSSRQRFKNRLEVDNPILEPFKFT